VDCAGGCRPQRQKRILLPFSAVIDHASLKRRRDGPESRKQGDQPRCPLTGDYRTRTLSICRGEKGIGSLLGRNGKKGETLETKKGLGFTYEVDIKITTERKDHLYWRADDHANSHVSWENLMA